jgi:hypothetical protein
VSFPNDLRSLIPAPRNGDGPDATRTAPALDGLPAIDDRGRVRVVTGDFDMGAWFDPSALPHDAEPDRP